jgi:hypothetical protein
MQSLLVIHFFYEKGKPLVNLLKATVFPKTNFLTLEDLDEAVSEGTGCARSDASHVPAFERGKPLDPRQEIVFGRSI